MNEIKLEKGILRVSRNANVLLGTTLLSATIINFSTYGVLSPIPLIGSFICLGKAYVGQKDMRILEEENYECELFSLRNMTIGLKDESLNTEHLNSIILSLSSTFLSIGYSINGIGSNHNLASKCISFAALLAAFSYAKSEYLYKKLINEIKVESQSEENVKTLNK